MPAISLRDEEGYMRRISVPASKEMLKGLSVGDTVKMTIEGSVIEREEREDDPIIMGEDGEEKKEREVIRRLGVEAREVEVYPKNSEFEDLAEDDEY